MVKRAFFSFLFLCFFSFYYAQIRFDFGFSSRFSFANSPNDSLGYFSFSLPFRLCNKIEFYRPSKNIAFSLNLDGERFIGYNFKGYSAQFLLGVEFLRGSNFPFTIEYSYGYNWANYYSPNKTGRNYLNEFNGINFHRLTICKYYNEPDGFKKEGIGATLEYWHRNDGRRIYALGVIVIVPYKDLIIKYSNGNKKKKGKDYYYYDE
jgi:hypothetical protein